jgi:alpha-L-fucosidase
MEIFNWPSGNFHIGKVSRTVTGAYLLADPTRKPLKFTATADGIDIALPAQALDPIATVLVLKTK